MPTIIVCELTNVSTRPKLKTIPLKNAQKKRYVQTQTNRVQIMKMLQTLTQTQ